MPRLRAKRRGETISYDDTEDEMVNPALTFDHFLREIGLPIGCTYFTLEQRPAQVHGDHFGKADYFPVVDRSEVVISLDGKGAKFNEPPGSNSEISEEFVAVV